MAPVMFRDLSTTYSQPPPTRSSIFLHFPQASLPAGPSRLRVIGITSFHQKPCPRLVLESICSKCHGRKFYLIILLCVITAAKHTLSYLCSGNVEVQFAQSQHRAGALSPVTDCSCCIVSLVSNSCKNMRLCSNRRTNHLRRGFHASCHSYTCRLVYILLPFITSKIRVLLTVL